MKIYTLDKDGRYIEDENNQRLYSEMTPCSGCEIYRWTEDERIAIKHAIELVSLLSDFRRDIFQETTGQADPSDLRDAGRLGDLYNSLREPFEYNSDEIGDLKDVLCLVAFSGVSDIAIDQLVTVSNKVGRFVRHLYDHQDADGNKIAQPDWSLWERVFVSGRFDWIDYESLFHFLPGIRGKCQKEIIEHLDREWVCQRQARLADDFIQDEVDQGKVI